MASERAQTILREAGLSDVLDMEDKQRLLRVIDRHLAAERAEHEAAMKEARGMVERLENGLLWATGLIKMYDEYLVNEKGDDHETVYSEVHKDGMKCARNALDAAEAWLKQEGT